MSLNILLNHPRSLNVIRNDTVEKGACKSLISPLKLCLYLVPFLRYSASKNVATLNTGGRIIKVIENDAVG